MGHLLILMLNPGNATAASSSIDDIWYLELSDPLEFLFSWGRVLTGKVLCYVDAPRPLISCNLRIRAERSGSDDLTQGVFP